MSKPRSRKFRRTITPQQRGELHHVVKQVVWYVEHGFIPYEGIVNDLRRSERYWWVGHEVKSGLDLRKLFDHGRPMLLHCTHHLTPK